jgi:hypothetical protein
MKNKSIILIIITLTLFFTSSCGVPECSFVIYDSTKEELFKDLKEYSLSDEFLQNVITKESFNDLIGQEAQEVLLNVMNSNKVTCDSIRLTSDSLVCNSNGKIILFSIDQINQVEVFYSDRTLSLLRNSAILGAFTSSIALLGYLPPNPPEPNWKSFVGLFGAGFIIGIIFDVSSSSYYCLVSKESFLNVVKEQQAYIK